MQVSNFCEKKRYHLGHHNNQQNLVSMQCTSSGPKYELVPTTTRCQHQGQWVRWPLFLVKTITSICSSCLTISANFTLPLFLSPVWFSHRRQKVKLLIAEPNTLSRTPKVKRFFWERSQPQSNLFRQIEWTIQSHLSVLSNQIDPPFFTRNSLVSPFLLS